jgi:hypothetical protein
MRPEDPRMNGLIANRSTMKLRSRRARALRRVVAFSQGFNPRPQEVIKEIENELQDHSRDRYRHQDGDARCERAARNAMRCEYQVAPLLSSAMKGRLFGQEVVPRPRLELGTPAFSVLCSTD